MGGQDAPQYRLSFVAGLGDALVHLLDPHRHLLGQAGKPLLQLLVVLAEFSLPKGEDARQFGGGTLGRHTCLEKLDKGSEIGSGGAGHAREMGRQAGGG